MSEAPTIPDKRIDPKRQNPARYRHKGGWRNRKPIHVTKQTHKDVAMLAKLGLDFGSTMGEVVETAIAVLKDRYQKRIQERKRFLRGEAGNTGLTKEKDI